MKHKMFINFILSMFLLPLALTRSTMIDVCKMKPSNRVECGWPGISRSVCESRGCCFNDSIPDVKWCFQKDVCDMNPSNRVECGWPGISRSVCESRGCCFNDSIPDVKWCFQKGNLEVMSKVAALQHVTNQTITCAAFTPDSFATTCVPPQPLEHGNFFCDDNNDVTCHVACDKGYVLETTEKANMFMECLDNTWTPLPTTFKCVLGTSKGQCLTACEKDGALLTGQTVGQLDLSCPYNQKIITISAHYGRLDSAICPTSAAFSTDCSAVGATAKVAAQCDGKESCTVMATNQVFGDPCIKTEKYLTVCYKCLVYEFGQKNISDLGYRPNCGAGWYDVQGQGVKNDYCRWVGNCGCRNENGGDCSWWSCALAGSNKPYSPKGEYTEPGTKPRQQNISDLGYRPNCGAGWYDVQGQGVKNDYCRWVGNCGCRNENGGDCSWWSCALAGSNKPYSPKGEYTEPGCYKKGECNNKKRDYSVEKWDTWGCANLNSCTDKDACEGRAKQLFDFCENNEDQPFMSRFIKDGLEITFVYPEGCDVGEPYAGSCYLLVSTPATWKDSKLDCFVRNGSLASIDNAETNDFIANLAGGTRAWIGASDAETEGVWKWTNGNIATFSNWSSGNPNNWSGNQNCLVINYHETGKWDDDMCDKLHPYVCQGQKLIGI